MSDVDKPFACGEPGCGMRFTNEDHLDVHKQKHMMSLALNSSASGLSNFMFADQTPTPTKFLKNCDDIGLFQELNKNPFEESFKKASELSKDQTLESVDTPTIPHREDDLRSVMDSPLPGPQLLRTPSITVTDTSVSTEAETVLQPTVTNNLSDVNTDANVKNEVPSSLASPRSQASVMSSFTETITQSHVGPGSPLQQSHLPQSTPVLQRMVKNVQFPKEAMTMQVLLTLPGGASIPVHIPAAAVVNPNVPVSTAVQNVQQFPLNLKANTVTKAAASSSTSALTKQKLKEAISQNVQNNILKDNMRVMSEAVEQVTSRQFRSDSEASTPENIVGTTTIGKRRHTSTADSDDGDPDHKRQRFLERNRAAAQRCRDKRKGWINNLEEKAEDLTQANMKLQNEVKTLRNEVAKLKSILLEHKDCPITLEQQARGILPGCVNVVASQSMPSSGSSTNVVLANVPISHAITSSVTRVISAPSTNSLPHHQIT